MAHQNLRLWADDASGGAILADDQDRQVTLHAIWLRERVSEPEAFDPANHQRLYEPNELQADLRVETVVNQTDGTARVTFSDGYAATFDHERLSVECGWQANKELPPRPVPWTSHRPDLPITHFDEIDRQGGMQHLLDGFFRNGFCIITGTPQKPGDLINLAQRFGYIRDTNWGRLFDVFSKSQATDLAYTGLALAAHTDNPYRFPVPGIQFLHCLQNTVAGGLSTIVDGLALIERLQEEAPEEATVLEQLPVRFRYDTSDCIVEDTSPLIERDNLGRLQGVRMSSRLDYVEQAPVEMLDLFYKGRRRLQKLAADPEFVVSFPFEPGLLLMMDNRRTLHGRTAFDGAGGDRHLQGCYIDHDGPRSLYHTLARDGVAKLGREAA